MKPKQLLNKNQQNTDSNNQLGIQYTTTNQELSMDRQRNKLMQK